MKTSFETRVSRMGLSSFVDINIFVGKYYFIKFLHILHFLKFLKSKFTQLPRPQKGNSGVSFNDTLLNFGLWFTLLVLSDEKDCILHMFIYVFIYMGCLSVSLSDYCSRIPWPLCLKLYSDRKHGHVLSLV